MLLFSWISREKEESYLNGVTLLIKISRDNRQVNHTVYSLKEVKQIMWVLMKFVKIWLIHGSTRNFIYLVENLDYIPVYSVNR